jgi:hypothetical protein
VRLDLDTGLADLVRRFWCGVALALEHGDPQAGVGTPELPRQSQSRDAAAQYRHVHPLGNIRHS